jgi:hypothetical protein
MTRPQIKTLQERIGTTADGFWGPKSIAACQAHLRRLMPDPSPWPAPGSAALVAYYGHPGDESHLVNLPVGDLDVRYEGQKVRTIRCHRKVSGSLARIIAALSATHPGILQDYCGCFNFRRMRGGSSYSLHAYGAAIDFEAGDNGNRTAWPVAASMPIQVMEAFAREGWLPAGAFWGRDAMHFQATR